MRSVKKYKIIVPVVAVCLTIAVLLTFRLSLAYLMDAEVKDNIITIGNVNLELTEDEDSSHPYEDSKLVAAGDSIVKAPALTNTGTEDEYVFLRIAVPVKNVTLLYEKTETITQEGVPTVTHKEGAKVSHTAEQSHYVSEPTSDKKTYEEIYRMIATGESGTPATVADVLATTDTDPKNEPCLSFGYNVGKETVTTVEGESAVTTPGKQGWVYLKRELNQEIKIKNPADSNAEVTKHYNVYYFGYNRRLKYDRNQTVQDKTVPLFDRVQLKSFIDEELIPSANQPPNKSNQDTYILVRAYGIQADSLDRAVSDNDLDKIPRDAYLTQTQLQEIFGIVERKAGGTT